MVYAKFQYSLNVLFCGPTGIANISENFTCIKKQSGVTCQNTSLRLLRKVPEQILLGIMRGYDMHKALVPTFKVNVTVRGRRSSRFFSITKYILKQVFQLLNTY